MGSRELIGTRTMTNIDREELKRKLDEHWDAPLVEVLAPEYFDEFHLPGAINVPLDENFSEAIGEIAPDKARPIVVYCASTECPMSLDAARKLDELGYTSVFDYPGGKDDWKAAGLDIETLHAKSGI